MILVHSGFGKEFTNNGLASSIKSRQSQNDNAVEDPQHRVQDDVLLMVMDTGQFMGKTRVSPKSQIQQIMASLG